MRTASSWRQVWLALVCVAVIAAECSAAMAQPGISISVALERLPGTKVTAPDGKNGAAGETIYYAFTVQNTGTLATSYRLSLAYPSGWSAALPLHSTKRVQTLQPGQIEIVPVAVTIAAGAVVGSTGDTTLTATADQKPRPSSSGSVTTTVVAKPEVQIVTAPPPQSGSPAARITYQFQVKNTGLASTAFTLQTGSSPSWATSLPSHRKGKTATLAPGQIEMVPVLVQVPTTAAIGATCRTTLTAMSTSRPRATGQDSVTTTVVAAGALFLSLSPEPPGAAGRRQWTATISHKGEPKRLRVMAQSSRGWSVSVDAQAAGEVELPDQGAAQASVDLLPPDGARGEDCLVISVLDPDQGAVLAQTAVIVVID